MSIVEFSSNHKLIGWIVVLLALAWGSFSYFQMPRFEDPEFLIRTAQIVTEYPGASPTEVADEVSDPLETEIQSMQEVDEIRSTSYYGYSVISVDIKHQFAGDREALQLVWSKLRSKTQDAEHELPLGAGTPMVNDDYGDVFGLYYLITGDGFSLKELDNYAKVLRKDLLSVEGVAKVSTLGEQQEAIYVEMSRGRAAALGVAGAGVFDDLSRQNTVLQAGSVRVGDRRLTIYPLGQIDSVEAIKNSVVTLGDGAEPVPLSDIATVSRGIVEPATLLAFYDGKPAIALGISSVSGTNVAQIGQLIRTKLTDSLNQRPNGIELHEFYHQGDVVNQSVLSFAVNVMLALLIVLITLLVFMGYRSALVIGLVLLVTIASTLATMQVVGIPMHRISLGALIIALGMLVDNAIVVTDGILDGVRQGQSVLSAARKIVARTQWALLGGTVVGVVAFAPIGFAPGDTAEYTNHLFWVILISLSFSWIYAISLTPMLSEFAFKSQSPAAEAAADNRSMRVYKKFLHQVLSMRWPVVALGISLFAASVWAFQFVKDGFFPTSTTPQIAIDYWLPESTDIRATARDVALIEQEIRGYEGIDAIHSVVGGGALRFMLIYSPQTPNGAYAQLILKLDSLDRIDTLVPKLQATIDARFPEAQARVWRFQLGPSQGSRIEAAFSGPDPVVLRSLAAQARELIIRDPQATAVKLDWRQRTPVIEPSYDAKRGARLGVSREDFVTALNRNYSGNIVGSYRETDELLPIIARSSESERGLVEDLGNIQVPSRRTGATAPLSEALAGVEVRWRDAQMLRENRIWTLKVQADPVAGALASSVFNRVRPQLEAIPLPPGYALRWDGEYGDSQQANAELAKTLPLGLLAMVLTVILLFNALRQAAIIWLTVPLASVGVVIGLLSTGTALEFMAILGVLSLSGLLIKNAIVLVDQMDSEIREGKPRYDAVIDSAGSRVRPVMMGALTTVLGVIPLVSDVFFASMAIVIVFGLSFATLLTLIFVPALYAVFMRIPPSESKVWNTGVR